jgi:hypothetical protein
MTRSGFKTLKIQTCALQRLAPYNDLRPTTTCDYKADRKGSLE